MRLVSVRRALVAALAALALCAPAASAAELRDLADAALKPTPKGWLASARIIQLASGKVLYSLRADEPMMPASVNKIITSIAAYEYLGERAQFITRIYTRGPVRDGRLEGDLIIQGGGDPNISGRFYDGKAMHLVRQWAEDVRSVGITAITGDIIADDTIFDREFVHPDWPTQQNMRWYVAQVSGLAFNDNCADVYVRCEKQNGAWSTSVFAVPDVPVVQFEPKLTVTPGTRRPVIDLRRPDGRNVITVRGKVPPKEALCGPYFVTLHNVPLVFAEVFRQELARRSVVMLGKAAVVAQRPDYAADDMRLIVRHVSPLTSAVWVMNKRSQNFAAECVLKFLGAAREGQGTFAGGAAAVADLFKRLGLRAEGVHYVDGSGLARTNRMTTTVLTELLRRAHLREYNRTLLKTLSATGEPEGTLRRRLASPPYEGRIWAKTGTLNGVTSLAGYAVDAHGEPQLAFAILMNKVSKGYTARRIQDDLCRAMVDWLDKRR